MKKNVHKIIRKTATKTEKEIDAIIAREKRSFPLFLRRIPKPELTRIKQKIRTIVESYPPKARPFIMSWLVAAYFSIIPGAGTLSLLFFGSLAKYLNSRK